MKTRQCLLVLPVCGKCAAKIVVGPRLIRIDLYRHFNVPLCVLEATLHQQGHAQHVLRIIVRGMVLNYIGQHCLCLGKLVALQVRHRLGNLNRNCPV